MSDRIYHATPAEIESDLGEARRERDALAAQLAAAQAELAQVKAANERQAKALSDKQESIDLLFRASKQRMLALMAVYELCPAGHLNDRAGTWALVRDAIAQRGLGGGDETH